MRTSESIDAISAALAKAQKTIKTAAKASANPYFHSRYSDLSEIVEACRSALAENDLSVIQAGAKREYGWVLVTRLAHKSGQWFEGEFPLLAKDQTAQALGSATTYAKRYSLAAMVGVVSSEEDDDGEAAMGRISNAKAPPLNNSAQVVAKPVPTPKNTFKAISDEQRKLAYLFATQKLSWTDEQTKQNWQNATGKESSKDWGESDFDSVMTTMKGIYDGQQTKK